MGTVTEKDFTTLICKANGCIIILLVTAFIQKSSNYVGCNKKATAILQGFIFRILPFVKEFH